MERGQKNPRTRENGKRSLAVENGANLPERRESARRQSSFGVNLAYEADSPNWDRARRRSSEGRSVSVCSSVVQSCGLV